MKIVEGSLSVNPWARKMRFFSPNLDILKTCSSFGRLLALLTYLNPKRWLSNRDWKKKNLSRLFICQLPLMLISNDHQRCSVLTVISTLTPPIGLESGLGSISTIPLVIVFFIQLVWCSCRYRQLFFFYVWLILSILLSLSFNRKKSG